MAIRLVYAVIVVCPSTITDIHLITDLAHVESRLLTTLHPSKTVRNHNFLCLLRLSLTHVRQYLTLLLERVSGLSPSDRDLSDVFVKPRLLGIVLILYLSTYPLKQSYTRDYATLRRFTKL